MEVKIIPSIKEAHAARGVVVILDIFRASNTIMALLQAGVGRLILLGDLDLSLNLRQANPDWLLFGERKGIMLPGMDGDNSPSKIMKLDLRGRTAILSTSAGTQPLGLLGKAGGPIFYGCFPNSGALLKILRELNASIVNLMPMGRETIIPVVEDNSAAEYLQKSLLGQPVDFYKLRRDIMECDSTRRMKERNLDDDLEFCTSLDTHDLVPVVDLSGEYPEARPWR